MAANLWLSVFWLTLGVVVGALAAAARLDRAGAASGGSRPLASRAWAKVGVGAVAALLGGWLGVLVFGRLFSTATAVWVSALCAALLPWLMQRDWRRVGRSG